jgi:hypothetical protein
VGGGAGTDFVGAGGTAAGGFLGTGGAAAGGSAGSSAVNPADAAPGLPDPATVAQWDCRMSFAGCELGTGAPPYGMATGLTLTSQCPVDRNRPRTAADCPDSTWFSCYLAYYTDKTPILVNCACAPRLPGSCDDCPSIRNLYVNPPAQCNGPVKVCGCIYAGILVK